MCVRVPQAISYSHYVVDILGPLYTQLVNLTLLFDVLYMCSHTLM